MNQRVRQFALNVRPYLPTLRLAGSYLGVIMVMSLGFSAVIYNISAREIGRQIPPNSLYGTVSDSDFDQWHDFFAERISHAQHELINRLVLLNVVMLLG